MTQVCTDREVLKHALRPLKELCFDAEGELKPLPKVSPNQYLNDPEIQTNGKFDFVLKDAAGKFYHLVTAVNQNSRTFSELRARFFLKTRKDAVVSIEGRKYRVIGMDEGLSGFTIPLLSPSKFPLNPIFKDGDDISPPSFDFFLPDFRNNIHRASINLSILSCDASNNCQVKWGSHFQMDRHTVGSFHRFNLPRELKPGIYYADYSAAVHFYVTKDGRTVQIELYEEPPIRREFRIKHKSK